MTSTTTHPALALIEVAGLPLSTLDGERITLPRAIALLDRFGDRITVSSTQCPDTAESVVMETLDGTEPWSWDYRGADRSELGRSLITWMLATQDEDLGLTARIWTV